MYCRWATLLLAAFTARAETTFHETRSTLEKWVETRQLISKTKSDWQSDKEMLEQTAQLLERELQGLEEQFAKLGTNSTQVEKERLEAELLLQSSEECLDKAKQFASSFQGQITNLVPKLPLPLQEMLQPQLNRFPADPGKSKMLATERMQVEVGVLNELDKFNSSVSVFSEKRRNTRGEEVAVETVYIGLGAAYFVNEAGDFAGTGAAGANGWQWTAQPEIGASVKEVVRIYRNERPAKFVSLPAKIQ